MMRRLLFVFVLILTYCSVVPGQAGGGEAKAPVGPKLWLESAVIDLGKIAVDQEQIEGVVRYMNEGDETLEISGINGPCDCFAGFEADKVLPPGHGGELIVRFDKSKIESGPVKRLVRFETNDPANKVVRVNFSFEIERTDSEELRWLRKDLTAVRRQLQLLRADMRKVLAALNNPRATAAPSRTRTAARKPDTNVYDVKIGSSPILGKADAAGGVARAEALLRSACGGETRRLPSGFPLRFNFGDGVIRGHGPGAVAINREA